jgi:pilus assembly protein CpaC
MRTKTLHPVSTLTRRTALALLFAVPASVGLAQNTTVAASNPEPAGFATVSVSGSSTGVSRLAVGGETLHVIVGHSMFLNGKARFKRVYVTDPAVLNSFTLSPSQIIVTAMAPGVSSLVLQDETGQAQSYTVSADLDIEGLRSAVADAMRDEPVKVEVSGTHVILSGTVPTQAAADNAVKIASLYTKDVANSLTIVPEHVKQVRLKVRFLEVDRSKATQFGINLFYPGSSSSVGGATTGQFPSNITSTTGVTTTTATTAGAVSTTTPTTVSVSNPLNFLFYNARYNIGATIQDLETKQVLQILAEPTITAISGQKGSFLAGGEFPFPVIQPGSGAGTSASVTVQFRPYGVKLDFTPTVNDDGTIRLKVMPEVSTLDYTNAVTISGFSVPALSTRRADTEVELRSNQSFAISGLLDQRTTDAFSKTPGISSVPILGALFKSKNISRSNTELVVIVTPEIIDPLTDNPPAFEPRMPSSLLNSDKFDKSLPKPDPEVGFPATKSPLPHPMPENFPAAKPATSPAPSPSSEVPPAQQPAPQSFDPATASAKSNMVQIMAISHREDADSIVSALKRKGYDVAIRQDPKDSLLHLQVGPYPTKNDAEAMRQRLVKEGYNATIQP